MSTLPVNCNRCGSPVKVGPDIRFVTCSQCCALLVVVRTPTSVFTDIAARQKELERIDRKWEQEKQEHHTWTGKSGGRHANHEVLKLVVIFAIFGIALLVGIVFAIKDKRFEWVLMAFVLGAPVGAWLAVTIRNTRRYWRAEAQYYGGTEDAYGS